MSKWAYSTEGFGRVVHRIEGVDIAAWQQRMMQQAMARAQQDAAAFAHEADARAEAP